MTYHVVGGKVAATPIGPSEVELAVDKISECSIIYVLQGIGRLQETVAGFVGNKRLHTVQLLHLIDDRPPGPNGTMHQSTLDMLGIYIRYLFADFDWIDRVTVPSKIGLIDKLFDLRVSGGDVSCVTLADAQHRPRSSRPFTG